ncbi:MAG: c-type cytochrome [Methylococcales bacterium]
MKSLKIPLSLALLLACGCVLPVSAADLKAGEQKSENCVGCHGAKGQSSNPQVPKLAAQQSAYRANQLAAFKAGERKSGPMQAMAGNLTEDDMSNLAGYFAGLSAVKAGGDASLAKAGQAKAAMCLGCHGSAGEGRGQFPRLAGQQPDYLVAQLKNFKAGARKGGPMQGVAGSLSEEDMKAIAAYLAGL